MVEARQLGPDEIKELEDEISRLETIIATQSTNGLFDLLRKKSIDLDSEACYRFVKEAREPIKSGAPTYAEYILAKAALDQGWETLDKAVSHATTGYRVRSIYAGDSLGFLLVILALLSVFGTLGPDFIVLGFIPIRVPVAGAIGAVLRFMWDVGKWASDEQYAKIWFSRVLSVPFVGALLSSIVYLVYLVALLAVGKSMPTGLDVQSLLISLLAGFGWEETYVGLSGFAKQTIGSIFQKSQA